MSESNTSERSVEETLKSPFVHLHAHSMYSLLDAVGNVEEIVGRAKELGYDSFALTDHAALYGAIEFYEAAKKIGIKPILGVEAYIAPNKHTDKRPRIDEYVSHLTILAETNEGYQNLLRLISVSYLEGFYYKPRMDKDLLRQFHTGLIALSGCSKGEIPKACQSRDFERAEHLIKEYIDIFGQENFFLELVHHPESSTQNDINASLIQLARKTGTPLVATKDVHYIHADDADAQDALQCIHDGKVLTDNNRYSISTIDHSLVSPEEMIVAFSETPEAITNTRLIADRCNVSLEIGVNKLPVFEVPDGQDPDLYLRELCQLGLHERYGLQPIPEAQERLDFELATILRMGFSAYFLIVHDYVNWAKKNGVIVGPGRGSAAGSIVAYVLRITNLDPLKYGLLFERFLNPDRISMPDVDMDFDDVKRKDVIEYVSNKYGHDRVAGIITFGTMAARAAVRDVGRVMGMTFQEVDQVAKIIPPPVQGKHTPLAESVKESPDLRAIYENDSRVHQLIDLAIKLEGTTRHASQHACGIVISPRPLVEFAPLQKAQGGDVDQVIQYSLHSSESVGLLKMDFLGLSNLTVIRECIDIVAAVHGISVDIDSIPLDNPETYELLGRAETTGVFQLESDGMKRYIKELKPTVIEDIIAMVALYRPGPMQFIDSFIARKHGKEKIVYLHPLLENALRNTYGIPVYQEQVMQVSKDMAGFTGGEADTLRKAMGKKIAKLMAEMREKFIVGSMKNGVRQEIAQEIFKQFEEFAAYGFNKSHAACYALVAYQTAYLKAHWPECFMAALMNSDSSNLDRITIEIEECRRMGLVVLAPDINESFAGFSVVKGSKPRTIRFGLKAIKGLGEDVVEQFITERKKHGAFTDLADIISRGPGKTINRKSLESLIRSGAFDRFGDRNQMVFNVDTLLDFHKQQKNEASSGQFNLFAAQADSVKAQLQLKPAPPGNPRELLSWEKELLGLYVSAHPYREYSERLAAITTPISHLRELKKEKKIRVGGVLILSKNILTKNNEHMVFAKLEDLTGSTEAIVFPRVLADTAQVWVEDKIVIVSGRPQEKDGEMKILVETAFEVTAQNIDEILQGTELQHGSPAQIAIEQTHSVQLHMRANLPDSILTFLRHIFDEFPGQYPVIFLIDDIDGVRRIKSSAHIAYTEEVVRRIEAVIGKGAVKLLKS
ncbi:DNA polymerase III subunit alpha [Candidatus Uhrbacteria bacterium]|nr:DNA polymerase III subunit alpha [Candidatus Uhrbacteria bacterium]